jgi:uncharacterized protein
MKYGLDEQTISKINAVFSNHPKIKQVKIYGSRAKGNYHHGSDIDLCIFADELSNDELNRIKDELDDLMLPYGVDVCDYTSISNDELREHIEMVGVIF